MSQLTLPGVLPTFPDWLREQVWRGEDDGVRRTAVALEPVELVPGLHRQDYLRAAHFMRRPSTPDEHLRVSGDFARAWRSWLNIQPRRPSPDATPPFDHLWSGPGEGTPSLDGGDDGAL